MLILTVKPEVLSRRQRNRIVKHRCRYTLYSIKRYMRKCVYTIVVKFQRIEQM